VTEFFEEVEEQLRSDQYRRFARTALPWILGIAVVAVVAVLGYWGYDTWRGGQVTKASETYSEALDAFTGGDREKARQLFTQVSQSDAKAYKSLSLMHLAAYAQRESKTADAVKLLDQAAEAAPDPLLGDAARLKSALALLDTAPLTELEGRLKPLMDEGRPYRVQAREALAFAKLRAGDMAGARGDFVLLSQALDATQGVQTRAQAAIGLIDSGSAKAVADVVKAAQALPPPMTVTPGQVVGPAQGPQPQGAAPQ
jgi:hypothetical protein